MEKLVHLWVFLVVCVSIISAEDCDLSVTSLAVNNPDPSVLLTVYPVDTDINVVLLSFFVKNNGLDHLVAAASGINYDLKLYLAEVNSDETAMIKSYEVTTFVVVEATGLSEALVNGSSVFYTATNFVLKYPRDRCSSHGHLCVRVEKGAGGTYTDSNPANDIICLPFIQKTTGLAVGLTDCPSDIIITALKLSPPLTFDTSANVAVTFSIDLKNAGGIKIPGSTSDLGFSDAFIANTASESASIKYYLTASFVWSGSVLTSGLDEWETVPYTNFQVTMSIPVENCYSYLFFCVKFEPAVGTTFDSDATNNVGCTAFGASSEFGSITCPPTTTTPQPTTTVYIAPTTKAITTAVVTTPPKSDPLIVSVHIGVLLAVLIVGIILGILILLLIQCIIRACKLSRSKRKVHNNDEGKSDEKKESEKSKLSSNGDVVKSAK